MPRTCGNCAKSRCFYRGIINPCDEHKFSRVYADLRKKATELIGKPMDFVEGRFVTSATTLESFTPKQASWLRGIHVRLCT